MAREEMKEKLMEAMQSVADEVLWARADDLLTGEEDEALECLLVMMSDIAYKMGM